MIIAAFSFSMIVFIAAMVIDLAVTRNVRASHQVAADSAATAAASTLADLGGQGSCEMAKGYLVEAGHSGAAGIDCSTIPSACAVGTSSGSAFVDAGSVRITLVHPVDDGHTTMQAGAIGAPTQTTSSLDGDRCDRFSVQMEDVRSTFFGAIAGVEEHSTSIHAVATSTIVTDEGRAINLVLLEPHDCQVLTVSGGGGTKGGVLVLPTADPATGVTWPGRIAIDSDGTGSCNSKGVVHAGGTGAVVRADGPAGCAAERLADGPGAGCGEIHVAAIGPSGCGLPACSKSGVVAPDPTTSAEPTTRALVDWRYNCKTSYPASVNVPRCPVSAATPPYIDQLVAAVGSSGRPTGYRSYSGEGYPCDVKSGDVTVPVGNWVIDCELSVSDSLRFQGGNLVFDDDVELVGSARLEVNASNGNSFHWTSRSPLDISAHSGRASFAYFRDGALSMGAQSILDLDQVMVYQSASSSLDIGSGGGSVTWIAPTTGPFEDLSLWSESSSDVKFGGGSSLHLEGVMFAPVAHVDYSGSGSQQQVAAQFIARTLATNGGGLLAVRPLPDRAVLFPEPTATLIR